MNTTLEPRPSQAAAPVRGRPLLPVRGVMSVLDVGEREVLAAIEDGSLLWAWDLSLQPERARRKLLRVLPECVEDFSSGRACRLEWPDIFALLLPPNGETVFATESSGRSMSQKRCQCATAAQADSGLHPKQERARRLGPGPALQLRGFLEAAPLSRAGRLIVSVDHERGARK